MIKRPVPAALRKVRLRVLRLYRNDRNVVFLSLSSTRLPNSRSIWLLYWLWLRRLKGQLSWTFKSSRLLNRRFFRKSLWKKVIFPGLLKS